jgi:hypothetical protein
MPEIVITLPTGPTTVELESLRREIGPQAQVYELTAEHYSFDQVAFGISLGANALQVVDILANWLKRTPRGNQAVIRLSDGRTLKMEADADPDDFVKQLKAALKKM